jgi:Fe2+ transport system protein FeoA
MEKTLNELKSKESGKVKRIYSRGELHRRLLDMGVVKGARIEVVKVAPFGDPVDIQVKGYHLSLRKREAAQILLEVE